MSICRMEIYQKYSKPAADRAYSLLQLYQKLKVTQYVMVIVLSEVYYKITITTLIKEEGKTSNNRFEGIYLDTTWGFPA
jgi:hypothetical protein